MGTQEDRIGEALGPALAPGDRAHRPVRRILGRAARRSRLLLAALALAMVLPVAQASPAVAGSVGACNPWWSSQNHYVCVGVSTGSKNYSNRTQYVYAVAVRTHLEPWRLEAWIGDGPTGVAWYRTASGETYVRWPVNRWVKNGSGICGAYHHRYGGRSVACIKIKV